MGPMPNRESAFMSITRTGLVCESGSLRLETPWSTPANGEILVNGEPASDEWVLGSDGQWLGRCGHWQLETAPRAEGGCQLTLTNTSPAPAHLGAVHFGRWQPGAFSPALPTAPFRELVHGGSFRNVASGVRCVGRETADLDAASPGNLLVVYQHDGGTALLLGVIPPLGEAFSELVTLHSEPHLEGDFGVEIRHVFDCTVAPDQAVRTAPVVALSGAAGVELMAAFGELWQKRLERRPAHPPTVGWNSWDYYSGAITRRDMDENLEAAAELLGDGPRYLVIDEGWEQQWGTWEPNGKFADGLEAYCRHVRERGWIPGIWTAPLLVNTYNPLYLQRPDWFAARADGQVQIDSYAYGPMAYLDVTRPDVIAHIENLFRRLRAAGFEYFKVDFSHCILNAERFGDPGVGRADLIRRAFAAIRRAIGDDAYLLSCGSPYESVAGLVDGVRTTGDIHIHWGHVLRNAGALSARWWMQGRLWNCDPDFLVVRGPDTARPPYSRRQVNAPLGLKPGWLAGRVFNEMEARTWALLVHLTGGDVVLSDPLRQLLPAGLDILRAVRSPRPAAAVPADLFESEQDLPRTWVSRGIGDTLVGLFNWSDKPARLDFEPAEHGLRSAPVDFWTGEPLCEIPKHMARRSSLALIYPSVDGA